MEELLRKIWEVTLRDADGNGVDGLIRNATEELGEFCAAVSIEDGYKPHKNPADLKETSAQEAVDSVICSLSLFFVRGGTIEQLIEYGTIKVDKWDRNVNKRIHTPKEIQ